MLYSQGIYPLGYYPHNIHFLWAAATQMDDRKTALAAARKTAEKVSLGLLEESAAFQDFAAIPYQSVCPIWGEGCVTHHSCPGKQIPASQAELALRAWPCIYCERKSQRSRGGRTSFRRGAAS